MIRFFSTLRQRLLSENRMRNYTAYALGEIVLVVIGILIALQVNNWNENRKKAAYELTLLREIDLALTNDSLLIARLFEPRMDLKEKAIDSLIGMQGRNVNPEGAKFMDLYRQMSVNFNYRYNQGPYETLKSNGLDIISSDQLRSEITEIYEVTFPAFKFFIETVMDRNIPLIMALKPDFLVVEFSEVAGGPKTPVEIPGTANVLNHPSFKRVMYYQAEIAGNNRSRINSIKSLRAEFHNLIRAEIQKRSHRQ